MFRMRHGGVPLLVLRSGEGRAEGVVEGVSVAVTLLWRALEVVMYEGQLQGNTLRPMKALRSSTR